MDELLDLATPEATAHLHANEVLIDAMLSAEYWRQLNPHLSVAGTRAGDASRPIAVPAALEELHRPSPPRLPDPTHLCEVPDIGGETPHRRALPRSSDWEGSSPR